MKFRGFWAENNLQEATRLRCFSLYGILIIKRAVCLDEILLPFTVSEAEPSNLHKS